MPMMPFAPGRLSTITCWPQVSVSFWATARAMMSTPPPVACGTMIRTGRAGNCCAAAAAHRSAALAAQPSRKAKVERRKAVIRRSLLVVVSTFSRRAARPLVLARAQDLHQVAHRLELLEARHRADGLLDGRRRQHGLAIAAELVLDLAARQRVLRRPLG